MTKPVTPTNGLNGYRPGTALGTLVHRARQAPPQCRLNDDDAQSAQVTLTLGLAAIGRLMSVPEAVRELDEREWSNLGDLLWSLAETSHQLGMMIGDRAMETFVEGLKKEATHTAPAEVQ